MNLIDTIARKFSAPAPTTESPRPPAAGTINERQAILEQIPVVERELASRLQLAAQRLAGAQERERQATAALEAAKVVLDLAQREYLGASLALPAEELRAQLHRGAVGEIHRMRGDIASLWEAARVIADTKNRDGDRDPYTDRRERESASNNPEVQRCCALAAAMVEKLNALVLEPVIVLPFVETQTVTIASTKQIVEVPVELADAYFDIRPAALPMKVFETRGEQRFFLDEQERRQKLRTTFEPDR